jgi:galactitol-specific phosphotransferase system IIB component
MTIKSGTNARIVVIGIIAFGLGALTNALGQTPPEITMFQSELKRVIKEAQVEIRDIVTKCDKCSSEAKTNGPKAILIIAQVADNLEKITNKDISKIANTCKK